MWLVNILDTMREEHEQTTAANQDLEMFSCTLLTPILTMQKHAHIHIKPALNVTSSIIAGAVPPLAWHHTLHYTITKHAIVAFTFLLNSLKDTHPTQ